MKIYTRTGDKGETGLFGGQRVPKDALRVDAYGTLDELNSVLGLVLADHNDPEIELVLKPVQHRLFDICAALATPQHSAVRPSLPQVLPADVEALEQHIDRIDSRLKPVHEFILPGGSRTGALLHFARAVCRRAERLTVRLSHEEKIGETIIPYLNRLSDLLFVLARYANQVAKVTEPPWNSTGSGTHA